MGWIFGSFTKKIKRLEKDMTDDVKKKLDEIAEKFDHIAQERINQSSIEAEKLKNGISTEIQEILNITDGKVRQQVQEIDRIRQETLQSLEKQVSQADHYVDNRINQLSLVLMTTITTARSDFYKLEQQVAQDLHDVINHLEFVVDKTLEQVRNELKKNIGHAIPSPFDPCRRELKLGLKPGALLSDMDLYRLSKCYELKKLNEETPVEKIREVYGQLQLNAVRLFILAKGASGLQKLAMEDWLKYGMLCDFWYDLSQRYNSVDLEQLQVQSKPTYLLEQE